MAVQFVLGRSGTGKTSLCIERIVKALSDSSDDRPLLLLVPEQATYQAERAILSHENIAGFSRLNVVSFDRLGFLLSGKNSVRPAISRIGQQMVVHRILRDNKNQLQLLGSSADSHGLAGRIADTIVELHRYDKRPEDIEQLLVELEKDENNKLTAMKFADIALVLAEYLKSIEGKFVDPDIEMIESRQLIANADFIKDAQLWVDGFAGFTTAEMAMLTELLKTASETQIAFCLDPDKTIDKFGMFSPTEQTYAELLDRVKKCRLELAEPVVLKKPLRFCKSKALSHIERNLFDRSSDKISVGESVRIISAASSRSEIGFIAKEILRLVKQKGFRFRDIAVIASDIESCRHYIKACFDDYDIPFFIDKPKTLDQHPAVAMLSSALQLVINGFSHADIFGYLKSDLVPIERGDIDLLENYCLAFGVKGDDWQKKSDWRFAGSGQGQFDQAKINKIRTDVLGVLLELQGKLGCAGQMQKKITAAEFTKAIYGFLDELGISKTIQNWIETASKQKDYTAVDEHQQFFDKLASVFDEFVEVFGDSQMNATDFMAVINSAFSQMTMAFIPPRLDQVLVGSIERSRHPDLKAVFLTGATQKQFPALLSQNSLLSDYDREAAESNEFALAPGAVESLIERQYLAYIAFTRPSQLLYVSYPATDGKASPTVRSPFIDTLALLFDDLDEETVSDGQGSLQGICNENELADILCAELGKDEGSQSGKISCDLLDELCCDEKLGRVGRDALWAVGYDNHARLNGAVVKELVGERIKSSATKLSSFAACPYQYFARYILGLKERDEFKFEPLDIGSFYHNVLDAFLKRLNSEKLDWAGLADERLTELLNEEISKILKGDSFIANFKSHSLHNAFLINSANQILQDFVTDHGQSIRAGSFRPKLSEVSFGQSGEFELALADGHKLYLTGKVDRVDTAKIDGEDVAIVFDYKRTEKRFSWSKFFNGLDLQLPIYMLAMTQGMKIVGAFYIQVESNITAATLSELAKKEGSYGYKAKGIFDGGFSQHLDGSLTSGSSRYYNFSISTKDKQYGYYNRSGALRRCDFDKMLEFAKGKIIELVGDIVSGKIEITPYRLGSESPCGWCKYKSLCRFDWQINSYNTLQTPSKSQVLEETGGICG
ncbi:PD-(D/E)XK nuclease family protein [Planctomycetota bacterium]